MRERRHVRHRLFVHLPQSSTAPGAWPGVQVTGTDKFSGAGAVTAPAALNGKPYVADDRRAATRWPTSPTALPNNETGASFAGVYELRLRTSSPTDGVSDRVRRDVRQGHRQHLGGHDGARSSAAAAVDADPTTRGRHLGGGDLAVDDHLRHGRHGERDGEPRRPARPSRPGRCGWCPARRRSATATLSPRHREPDLVADRPDAGLHGAARSSTPGVTNAFERLGVGREDDHGRQGGARASRRYKVTKAPTPKKKGTATVTVADARRTGQGRRHGLGRAQEGQRDQDGQGHHQVNGTGTVKLPKLPTGKWTVTVTYAGDTLLPDRDVEELTSSRSRTTAVRLPRPRGAGGRPPAPRGTRPGRATERHERVTTNEGGRDERRADRRTAGRRRRRDQHHDDPGGAAVDDGEPGGRPGVGLVRPAQGARPGEPRHARRTGDGADRAVGLRQVDVPAHPQPDARAGARRRARRRGPARRPGHLRPRSAG